MFLEAPKKRIVSVFVSESLHTQLKNTKDLNKNYAALRNKLSGLEYEIVADAIYEKMSDTVTPQGVLAVVKSPEYTLSEILGGTKCSETDGGKSSISGSGTSAGLYIILENLQDPGNLGTIFRTAEAAGVKGIILGEGCERVHIVNELNLPILVMGLKDAVVAASHDGILISGMDESARIKPYVEAINQQIMFAEKSWGSYQVMDADKGSMVVLVTINPGHHMSYHSHARRDEIWTILRGSGSTIVDGMEQPIKPGDVVTMAAGCRHTAVAGKNGLQLIEVQLGDEIDSADKQKYEL